MKSKSIKIDTNGKELSEAPPNNSNMNIHTIKQNNDIELPVNNNVDIMKDKLKQELFEAKTAFNFWTLLPMTFSFHFF